MIDLQVGGYLGLTFTQLCPLLLNVQCTSVILLYLFCSMVSGSAKACLLKLTVCKILRWKTYSLIQAYVCKQHKGTQTIWKAGEWNEELESNVWPERPPENSANTQGTLPTLRQYSLYISPCWVKRQRSQRRIGKQLSQIFCVNGAVSS